MSDLNIKSISSWVSNIAQEPTKLILPAAVLTIVGVTTGLFLKHVQHNKEVQANNTANTFLKQATDFNNKNQYPQSIEATQRGLTANPRDPAIRGMLYFTQAHSYSALEKWINVEVAALNGLREKEGLSVRNTSYLNLLLAQAYRHQKFYNPALTAVAEGLTPELTSENLKARLYLERAHVFSIQNDFDAAIEAAQAGCATGAEKANKKDLYSLLTQSLWFAKRYDDIIPVAEEWLKLVASDPNKGGTTTTYYAAALNKKGQHAKAAPFAQAALAKCKSQLRNDALRTQEKTAFCCLQYAIALNNTDRSHEAMGVIKEGLTILKDKPDTSLTKKGLLAEQAIAISKLEKRPDYKEREESTTIPTSIPFASR